MHTRFWADDLVYVSSSGALRNKAEIVNSVRAEAASGKAPTKRLEAEDIAVRPFGSVAVVNFTLVAHEAEADGSKRAEKIRRYRNCLVFQLKDEGWQAVSWQSTAIAAAPKK
jgi:ketosteroid isomerase-like protein